VLSGRGLCDGLITRQEESYRLWRVVVCDHETSRMRRLKSAKGMWKIQPKELQRQESKQQTTNNKHYAAVKSNSMTDLRSKPRLLWQSIRLKPISIANSHHRLFFDPPCCM